MIELATIVAMRMMMLPVADARDQLSRLVNDAQTYRERFQISRNGRPAAVLMSQEDYDSLMETLEIMAHPDFVAEIIQGIAEDQAGLGITGDDLLTRITALTSDNA